MTIRRIFRLLFVLCLLVAAAPATARAEAATYYVAVNGSDSAGNGSSSQPWQTISYALQHVPDGSLILARPGTYNGQVVLRGNFSQGVTVRSETPYQARLRHNGQALVATGGVSGITLEGFDIAHSGPGSSTLVIHINGSRRVGLLHDITLRNNILHDSYQSDILKIDASSSRVIVEGNVFYNQTGSDEHIDINSAQDIIIRNNIFFNNFEGSGRPNNNDTSSYIVIKDSSGTDDQLLGSKNITVSGNVFLNWQGLSSSAFVMVGEDGKPYFEAEGVLVENNLMLGNSPHIIRAPLAVWGAKDVTFRSNTVSGDLPANAYAMLLSKAVDNQANENIRFFNNIWSDPTGTMGAQNSQGRNDFSDTPPANTASFAIDRNLYWNGGRAIPVNAEDKVNYTNDARPILGDPGLPRVGTVALPHWDPNAGRFGDGSSSIAEAFERLVRAYGVIPANSPAVGAADPANAPTVDILGRARGGRVDIGAYQSAPGVVVVGRGRNRSAQLEWQFGGSLPAGTTWTIGYTSPAGNNPSAARNLPADTRSYEINGLTNYVRHTFTVSAIGPDGNTIYSTSTQVLPTDIFYFLPLTRR